VDLMVRVSRLWITLFAAATACAQKQERAATRRPAASLVAWAASVDSLATARKGTERTYALRNGRLAPVRDSADWEGAEAEVRIFTAPEGRPLRHLEIPVSQSGDWTLELAHYFDAQGRTVVFASDGRYFRGCGGGIVHDRRRTVYGRDFRVVSSTRQLQDEAGKPLDEATCGHPYSFFAGEPRATYTALVQAGRAPPEPAARP
jgi:hypothetical protein